MKWQSQIKKYLFRLGQVLERLNIKEITHVLTILEKAYQEGHTIFTMGNGGSGTTASHMVCDFNNGASAGRTKKFRVMCLNDNMPTVSAVANDVSYDAVFEEQLKNWLQPEDVVMGISVSGNSKNIIRAIEYANKKGAITIGFCGFDGGQLRKKAKYCIHIKTDDMKIAEDVHSVIGHLMMKVLGEHESRNENSL